MKINNEFTNAEKEQLIQDFSAAWRRKDIETLMANITDDCVYGASVGPEPGATYTGRNEVRRGFEELLKYDEKSVARGGRIWIAGDMAFSEWSFAFTDESGREIEIKGCDMFEFSGDKIRRKDAYRKTYA